MRRYALLTLSLLMMSLASLSAQVPCLIGDDGLDIGCCTPVPGTNIPQFGQVFVSGEQACFLNCNLEQSGPMRMRLTHTPLLCDYALIDCEVFLPSLSGAFMRGTLYAKYSRTFMDPATATAVPRQVWRFLVNGDFVYPGATAAGSPCPVPPDAVAGQRVFFHGSIDFRCNNAVAGTTGYSARVDLSHLPGCFTHAPWSARPAAAGAGHLDRSYHLVGPGPVSWAGFAPPSGPILGEKTRSSRVSWGSPFAYFCLGEQDIRNGNLTSLGRNCPCGPVALSARYVEQRMDFITGCNMVGNTFSTVPLPGISGAGGLIAMPLATDGEGVAVTVYFGVSNYTDLCTAEGPYHAVVGSGTRHPVPLIMFNSSPTTVPPTATIDLGNSLVFRPGAPSLGYGAPYASTLVWQVNLP